MNKQKQQSSTNTKPNTQKSTGEFTFDPTVRNYGGKAIQHETKESKKTIINKK